MNLFSNAMKYTSTGFVKISLELEDDVSSLRTKATIKSYPSSSRFWERDFARILEPVSYISHLLKRILWLVAQGLGLSIVEAIIIKDIHKIKVAITSEPGTETEAVVRIPLTASLKPAIIDGPDFVTEVKEKVKGLTFSLNIF